ncbi:MAG: hypothetical protein AB7G25_09755 [Sphingomonadaceae bacterium]
MPFRAGFLVMTAFALIGSATAMARDPLGVFNGWGAFRDKTPHRCFAIAEPDPRRTRGDWRPFASVANWPQRNIRNQVHVRLRKNRKADTPVTLSIGPQKFDLVAGAADAWAADPRMDAAIVRAMRSGQWMIVSARAEKGGRFVDSYPLRGVATAIDAAMIACARRR